MAGGRRITWALEARKERRKILTYWTKRNKSDRYSIKLRKLIKDEIQFIAAHPDCGILSDIENVSYRVLRDYLIFFEENKNEILILSIWDGRQDPEKLKTRLE